ncbi:hypothetical protein [Pleionea sediminis]|uniref:hypothetical protein n=1 Tax=Pleionea sediminis TaxID=2569479 RepID=UPI0011867957|nr:hypothetical protein [Pleionea sediminis]
MEINYLLRSVVQVGIVLLGVIHLTGCIGFGATYSGTEVIEKPQLSSRYSDKKILESTEESELLTKDDVLEAFGKPTEVTTKDTLEVLYYEGEREWCGLIPVVIVPIPLFLPVCETYKRFTIENDVVIKAEIKSTDGWLAYCGPLVGMNKNWNTGGGGGPFCKSE